MQLLQESFFYSEMIFFFLQKNKNNKNKNNNYSLDENSKLSISLCEDIITS